MSGAPVSNPRSGGVRVRQPRIRGRKERNCHRKHVEDGSEDKCGVLYGKYELGRLLGYGTFAKVYLARNLRTGKSVAMKVVDKEKVIRVGMMEQVKREISVMKMVHHPNIVEFDEVMASKSKIYFSMELARGGELFSRIAKGPVRDEVARSYFQQLISAVDYCHGRGIYHRDLKPENLLLDAEGNLKVTDFGLSALTDHLRQDGLLHTACGTPAYVAPEVIGRKGYDGAKADIWSCGVILFVLLAGYLPFQDDNVIALYQKLNRGDFKCPPWLSSESRKLIVRMLDPNTDTRITINGIMESAWFKKSRPRSIPIKKEEQQPEFEGKQKETLNAFHIISFSEGFDLSPLFEKKKVEREELRFATTSPASSVISKLVELGKAKNFAVKKGEACVRLQRAAEEGRKGRLEIAAEIFPVTASFLVVEVKKWNGDKDEFSEFWRKELRPALEDAVWRSAEENTGGR